MQLSVTIITLNEEKTIARAIASVAFADEVIVIDAGSCDQTREIAVRLGARVYQEPWQGYGQQKNKAQRRAQGVWVLNIDADEVVSEVLAQEIQAAMHSDCVGFSLPRRTYMGKKWIAHGGWYPNYLVRLARRELSQWTEPAVHESLEVQGQIGRLLSPLDHYGFSGFASQVETNLRFARLGAQDLARRGARGGITLLLLKPLGKFIETYILKRGFLDGLAGFIIAVNASYSMFLKYAFLLEERALWYADSDS